MPNPTFSIVIPTYNRAHLIEKTIRSILSQSFHDFEIIVVDDGSTDNTEEVVKNIEDRRLLYFKKENAERGAARNFGRKQSTGKYVNFFDSDDLAYPHHLDTAMSFSKENNYPDVFHLNYDFRDDNYELKKNKKTEITNINEQLISGNLLSCNGVFIKRDISKKHPFNENRELSASEDYLLWLQLASQYQIFNCQAITSSIVDHEYRSVVNVNLNGLVKRKTLMIDLLFRNQNTSNFYRKNKSEMMSNAYSYIALHAILDSKISNRMGLSYFLKSLKYYPLSMFKKRSFAIIKRLIIKSINLMS